MTELTTHPHPQEERDGFRFRGGHPALDLPATLQARLTANPRELLQSPNDLGRWLVAAGLARTPPVAEKPDLDRAHRLREAIFAAAGAAAVGKVAPAEARDTLNRIASGASAVPMLSADGDVELSGPASALLTTLARDAVRLFGSEGADRIRQCQAPTCTLFFIDTSRSGGRRWCSMSGCGNKAKVADFRRRRRGAGTAG